MNHGDKLIQELKHLQTEEIIFVEGRAFVIRPVNEDDLKRLKEEKIND